MLSGTPLGSCVSNYHLLHSMLNVSTQVDNRFCYILAAESRLASSLYKRSPQASHNETDLSFAGTQPASAEFLCRRSLSMISSQTRTIYVSCNKAK